jgi:valyl-tRNA synthetase
MSVVRTEVETDFNLPKTYDPALYESSLYDWWEKEGFFKPETQWKLGQARRDAKPFVISMPPPNVTGALHIGHAMTAAVEDLMIRYHRMKGEPTLWVPGSDHAGIATQNVVERELAKEGLTRQALGRERFLERVWQWKREYGARITQQHRRLGVSCDWDRERFTLDEGLSRAVRVAFVRLYERGLIYRGPRLVNWCPRCQTAISDLEVEHEEEMGRLWTVRYYLEGGDHIDVATTRPETILGDTAVAVHPEDERYRPLIGRIALLPILGRRIPIIADAAVDPAFGTGAVKVTPGHDPNDYEMGQRHHLPIVNAMNYDGTMSAEAGPYAGLERYACRRRLLDDLRAAGQLIKEEDHALSIGHCQRCGTVVEPLISTQWFVKAKPLAEPAIAAVREGRIRIVPERFTRIYFHWMENIRDWCISRQLWWGHRIPVWYCDDCGRETCAITDPDRCAHCGSGRIRQDEDVLDTWFSSALWPFSTLGWPDDTPDLRTFYPTSVLETGYDILFFWVARMIMMGLAMTGDIPFHTVYLHGLIRDEFGRKYSKSLGNALDPTEVIEEYGTDALRFALVTSSTPGLDTKLAPKRVEAARNFANKIWNAARFVLGALASGPAIARERPTLPSAENLTLADRWILSRQHRLTAEVDHLMEDYQFGEAGRQIYEFLWGEYCDWYIEIAKARLYGDDLPAKTTTLQTLVYVLERTLRLLHPFMPFVTEAIWQRLPHEGPSIMLAPWPTDSAAFRDEGAEADMGLLLEAIRGIRNARAEYNVEPARRIGALVSAGARAALFEAQRDLLVTQARLAPARLHIAEHFDAPPQVATVVAGNVTIYLPLAEMLDIEAERARLAKELSAARAELARAEGTLARPGFLEKAPPAVVENERKRLSAAQEKVARLEARLAALER